MLSLKELEIRELLKEFEWIKEFDYVNFETLQEGYCFCLVAILDENNNMVDIRVESESYFTYLSRENDFWVFDALRNGNWVGLLDY